MEISLTIIVNSSLYQRGTLHPSSLVLVQANAAVEYGLEYEACLSKLSKSLEPPDRRILLFPKACAFQFRKG